MIHSFLNNPKIGQFAKSFVRGGVRGVIIGGLFALIAKLIGMDFKTGGVYKSVLFALSIGLSGMVARILLNKAKKQ